MSGHEVDPGTGSSKWRVSRCPRRRATGPRRHVNRNLHIRNSAPAFLLLSIYVRLGASCSTSRKGSDLTLRRSEPACQA